MTKYPSNNLQLAIIVVSCDNYSDLWQPFYTLFRRFWPWCPYKIYHVSNFLENRAEGVVSLLVGEDLSWSDNLIQALDLIEEEYVFMMIDDLFLIQEVCSEGLQEVFAWISRDKPDCVRLNPVPQPDMPYNKTVGIVLPGTLYRTATVMTIWKKTVLLDLLKPGENAWEFEQYGSVRSDKFSGFYSTHYLLLPFINGVIKGKWRRSAVNLLKSLGIPIQFERRKLMTAWETIKFHVQIMRSRCLRCLPSRYRRQIKELLLRGKYDYSLLK